MSLYQTSVLKSYINLQEDAVIEKAYKKYVKYFLNPTIQENIRSSKEEEYQVCIYGHSCGLSDRVMLNEIFENENCKSIKVYYYKDENDFNNKTMEISRHFKDNNSMRKKIVNFNPKDIIPQL